jgi:hypothetical protein
MEDWCINRQLAMTLVLHLLHDTVGEIRRQINNNRVKKTSSCKINFKLYLNLRLPPLLSCIYDAIYNTRCVDNVVCLSLIYFLLIKNS